MNNHSKTTIYGSSEECSREKESEIVRVKEKERDSGRERERESIALHNYSADIINVNLLFASEGILVSARTGLGSGTAERHALLSFSSL